MRFSYTGVDHKQLSSSAIPLSQLTEMLRVEIQKIRYKHLNKVRFSGANGRSVCLDKILN
jgi:hypothetical protein